MVGGASYQKFDDQGLHIKIDGVPQVLEVDNVIVCAGQEPLKDLEVRLVLAPPPPDGSVRCNARAAAEATWPLLL